MLAQPEYTRAAIADLLAQSVPTRLLIINQGVEDAFRLELERIAEAHEERILLWSHMPPLPSLSATWNRALDFVWAVGGEEALVVNADVRLHRRTVHLLHKARAVLGALFVSCVGVTPEQFDPEADHTALEEQIDLVPKGGPDFSCYLIAKACHEKYRFDEGYTPAYVEDLDFHRRLMLGGDGQRIFSVNLPFLHYASGTLKTIATPQRQQIERAIEQGSRAHHRKKWGGGANAERFTVPFDPSSATEGVTTADLFAKEREVWHAQVR